VSWSLPASARSAQPRSGGGPGVRIERTTGPARAPAGRTFDLGSRFAPGNAAGAVEFDPVGADALLGPPDEAYARALPPGRALTLVYATPGGRRLQGARIGGRPRGSLAEVKQAGEQAVLGWDFVH